MDKEPNCIEYNKGRLKVIGELCDEYQKASAEKPRTIEALKAVDLIVRLIKIVAQWGDNG
ncbi:hypothetical protein LCGC14_0664190 [marine sediment metagenome]|uniref:Uncharacterized protein n=1 Tax=marine sediment metagenome TaxID=412755 RepID=A0A0F9QXV3_9ZZZZ